jgi:hypothetical protein
MSNHNPSSGEKIMAIAEAVSLLAAGPTAPIPQQELEAAQPSYSYVQQILPNASPIESNRAEQQYESLLKIAKLASFEEQLEDQYETITSEKQEKIEEQLETSILANQPVASGSPDPDSYYELDDETKCETISTAVNIATALNPQVEDAHKEEDCTEIEAETSTATSISEAINDESGNFESDSSESESDGGESGEG